MQLTSVYLPSEGMPRICTVSNIAPNCSDL
jgi:hypothetical protein